MMYIVREIIAYGVRKRIWLFLITEILCIFKSNETNYNKMTTSVFIF